MAAPQALAIAFPPAGIPEEFLGAIAGVQGVLQLPLNPELATNVALYRQRAYDSANCNPGDQNAHARAQAATVFARQALGPDAEPPALAAILQAITNLTNTVDGIRNDVNAIRNDVNAIRNDVNAIRNDMAAMQLDLNAVRVRVDRLDIYHTQDEARRHNQVCGGVNLRPVPNADGIEAPEGMDVITTIVQLRNLPGPACLPWLQLYGIQPPHEIRQRRQELGAFLGVPPWRD